jgi:hypothetical protein
MAVDSANAEAWCSLKEDIRSLAQSQIRLEEVVEAARGAKGNGLHSLCRRDPSKSREAMA